MTAARPLRVLVVADVGARAVTGGAERVLWEHASGLAARGHAVRIVSRAPHDDSAARLTREGVAIREFAVRRASSLRFVRDAIGAARRAVEIELAEGVPDVLHLHQPLAGWAALRAAPRHVPIVYTFHSSAALEYRSRRGMTVRHRGGLAGRAGAVLLGALERACLRRAQLIHVLSDFSTDQLWRLHGVASDRIVRIPGGADTRRFAPVSDRAAARARLGLPPDRPLLLTVRNLEARMGLEQLLHAMAILRRRAPRPLLLVAGSGSRRAELQRRAAALALGDTVRFLGFVPDAALPRHYAVADAFVLPTRELEGFGLVTVEALACGTPVLGTPIGATPELLSPLAPALLFRDGSARAMAERLGEFIDDAARDAAGYEALRGACRRHALTHYGWDAAVDALESRLARLREGDRETVAAVACPACGHPMAESRLVYAGRRYRRCRRCGTRTAAVVPRPVELNAHYETDYPRRFPHAVVDAARTAMFGTLLERLERWRAPGRLLDVGASGGHLAALATSRGWRAVASDISSEACAGARATHGVPVTQADSLALPVAAARLDAVTAVNVIDQTGDPLQALTEARRVLAPGGVLVVRVPNAAFHAPWVWLLSRWRAARWRGWDRYPILHVFALGRRGLVRLAERAGFAVLEVCPSAAAQPSGAAGMRTAVRRHAAAALAAIVRVVAAVSGRRWLLAPSIELYARVPSRGAGQ